MIVMQKSAGSLPIKRQVLDLVRAVPSGSVATVNDIAVHLKCMVPLVATLLTGLSEDEREGVPWHRVVAKGGAVGRGPHRDRQFALLMREGVLVSPAGVVQDMGRVCVRDFDRMADVSAGRVAKAQAAMPSAAAGSASRSRGMRDKPGGGGISS